MRKRTDGYFRVKIGEVARDQCLSYMALTALLQAVDPQGIGLSAKTVSEHLNAEYCDDIPGRTAMLYCRALGVEISDLWEINPWVKY